MIAKILFALVEFFFVLWLREDDQTVSYFPFSLGMGVYERQGLLFSQMTSQSSPTTYSRITQVSSLFSMIPQYDCIQ